MKTLPTGILKKQKGASLLIVIAILGVLIAGLIAATSQILDNAMKAVGRQRDRIAAIQVLQEFAMLAQKANDVYVRNNNACGGLTQGPVGFCWQGPFPSASLCVANPLGRGNDICLQNPTVVPLTSTGQVLHVAQLTAMPKPQSKWEEWKDNIATVLENRELFVVELQKEILGRVSGEAHAIRPELILPDDAAPPGPASNTIANVGCNVNFGAPPANYACKQCTGGQRNVRCIELRVCVSQQGCGNINTTRHWYRQRVGIINRF